MLSGIYIACIFQQLPASATLIYVVSSLYLSLAAGLREISVYIIEHVVCVD